MEERKQELVKAGIQQEASKPVKVNAEEISPTENVLRRHIVEDPRKKLLAKHRLWLDTLQHEYPMPYHPFKIGVYIRYYNQTRYKNYLEKHIAQFKDDIALCRNWTLVDFYIDTGMSAPRMENAKEWCRLLGDCFTGKVDLIVTQKVSNVSSDPDEIAFVARTLATQKHPIGIYFISEDIFTLASYYRHDLKDLDMLPYGLEPLPEDELDVPMVYTGENKKLLEVGDAGDTAALDDRADIEPADGAYTGGAVDTPDQEKAEESEASEVTEVSEEPAEVRPQGEEKTGGTVHA